MLAYALNSQGVEYTGWTVGVPSAGGLPTILRSTNSGASWTRQGTIETRIIGRHRAVVLV
jgi:photosystem II stability/assembly factor-like uncharacterized protein